MNYAEVVEIVAQNMQMSKDSTKRALDLFMNLISRTAMNGEKVSLKGFGTFSKYKSKPRIAFGKVTSSKEYLRFKPYESTKKEAALEKRGVVIDKNMSKTGSIGKTCPGCGDDLREESYCLKCGTKPFEQKPPEKKEPKPEPKK